MAAFINNAPTAANGQIPIGGIFAHFPNIAGAPSPDTNYFEECDGHVCNNAASLLFGQVIPDLNNAGLFIRGGTGAQPGTTGGAVNHTHNVGAPGGGFDTTTNPTSFTDAQDNVPPFIYVKFWMRVV